MGGDAVGLSLAIAVQPWNIAASALGLVTDADALLRVITGFPLRRAACEIQYLPREYAGRVPCDRA